jgi:hypothetical protein
VYDTFKRRQPAAAPRREWVPREKFNRGQRGQGAFRPMPGTDQAVSPAVKASLLARSGRSGVLRMKETEIAAVLLLEPDLAARHGELLAELPFTDRDLDRFRHVLLNLAASGSSLEKAGVQTHFTRKGMADLLARFAGPAVEDEDPRTLFQRVVIQLRKQAGTRTGRPPDAMNHGAEST